MTRGKGIIPCPSDQLLYEIDKPDTDLQSNPNLRRSQLPHMLPDPNQAMPTMGVAQLAFSPCGTRLAALNAASPRCVYIFTLGDDAGSRRAPIKPKLETIVIFSECVRSLSWRPHRARHDAMLAMAYGTKAVGIFSGESRIVEGMGIPARGLNQANGVM